MVDRTIRMRIEAQDRVTGLRGIITGKTEYINGCVQWLLKPKVDKDGKLVDGCWIDTVQLEYVGPGLEETDEELKTEPTKQDKPGGPQSDSPTTSYRVG